MKAPSLLLLIHIFTTEADKGYPLTDVVLYSHVIVVMEKVLLFYQLLISQGAPTVLYQEEVQLGVTAEVATMMIIAVQEIDMEEGRKVTQAAEVIHT